MLDVRVVWALGRRGRATVGPLQSVLALDAGGVVARAAPYVLC